MRSTPRMMSIIVALSVGALTAISSPAQTTATNLVFPSSLTLDHARMQPFSINANLNTSDVLEFPAGASTSRASYDADRGAAKFSQFAKSNASPVASRSRGDFTPNHGRNAVRGLITVPTFQGAFVSNGLATEFPYFMIGTDPAEGATTTLPTKIVSFALNLHDANGGVTSVSFAPVEQLFLHSPNFDGADYTVGKHIQFGDAIQRAEFFNNMREDWHTNLSPEIVDRVTVEIPPTVRVRFPDGTIKTVPAYVIETASNGNKFVLLLDLVFNATIIPKVIDEINAGTLTSDAINVAMLFNTSLFSLNAQGGVGDCCVGGFHTYANDDASPQSRWIFAFAGWSLPGIFRGGVADVTSISHEISEALNDPFIDNIVPEWQFPGLPPGACQGNLETGDPVEVLPNSVFPVRIKAGGTDFIFHPQTEALLQWFEQGLPSDAIGGAYSYPDTTSLTITAQACPAPPTS